MTRLSFKPLAFLPAFLLVFGTLLSAQQYAPHCTSSTLPPSNPCKVFIGVGTSSVAEGLKVDYTVANTPATQYGVLAGDIILTLDGVPMRSQSELLRERDKHQQGDAFRLVILRNGVQQTIDAKFKACSEEELQAYTEKSERMAADIEARMEDMQIMFIEQQMNRIQVGERAILGVYENSEVNVKGLAIGTVIPGKGAQVAGLQSGDVVVNVDGQTVTGTTTLRNALASHKPGDVVTVVYQREGQTMQVKTTLSSDIQYFTQKTERDPCKVFIGVYTSGNALEGRGLRVNGVIDDTPAKESGVQPNDVILAFNGQAVNNYQELTGKRDQQKPGDAFRLTVLREGVTIEIKARFKACDSPVSEKETVVTLEETPASEERKDPQDLDNSLVLEVFEAYPSPTFGPVNIHFEAEAVPTTVRILDVTGKSVYAKELPQFGGSFNEQVNLSSQKAGNYVLSIQQGGKVRSKQIVLMPRA